MNYSFVLDDSLTSKRFTTRTEQLTKCCEPLQKMRVWLGASKTRLSPPPPSNSTGCPKNVSATRYVYYLFHFYKKTQSNLVAVCLKTMSFRFGPVSPTLISPTPVSPIPISLTPVSPTLDIQSISVSPTLHVLSTNIFLNLLFFLTYLFFLIYYHSFVFYMFCSEYTCKDVSIVHLF